MTVTRNGDGQPFEVFINTAKAGSEMAAVPEALGRLASYILRLASPDEPLKWLQEIYRPLWGIGGARSSGFGGERVPSPADAVAQVLGRHLDWLTQQQPATDPGPADSGPPADPTPVSSPGRYAHLCPECGQVSLVTTEGCASCSACGCSERRRTVA